mgnify:CR=1 FL=1
MANNLAKAEEHLAALQRICLIPCERIRGPQEGHPPTHRARAAK